MSGKPGMGSGRRGQPAAPGGASVRGGGGAGRLFLGDADSRIRGPGDRIGDREANSRIAAGHRLPGIT
jgi:hypothetical protein